MAPGQGSGREVLESGFRVLRALPDADEHRQMSSLAELTSIPRSTVHRLLRQLRRSKAVELRADGRWAVSPQLLGIAGRAQPLEGVRTSVNRVIQTLRDQTGATVSLVVPTETSLVAMEMIPGREELPIDAYAGIEMPDLTAAALVLDPKHRQSPRVRPFAAAVDDQDLLEGLTCYARLLTLPGGQRASLQIATSSHVRAENFAAHVQRAGKAIEALAARSGH
ncbi:helix-turn-helix domain-containing protein [Actinoallomurus rhizosphaericola]|uniref:helix-turn-helix domain-containing protein n=1 Tax=Actinoallomurus rhizosphaericola TaxID=2952536 RepID=UPI002093AE29|nr:helix-turn-helix domain-containing protein [Actinoallomurus rhizosphaericola]MCO6000069.1 helix-turn-helix domain-containing protein [Actinoallomurus rhizosphaericola]